VTAEIISATRCDREPHWVKLGHENIITSSDELRRGAELSGLSVIILLILMREGGEEASDSLTKNNRTVCKRSVSFTREILKYTKQKKLVKFYHTCLAT
jgi:hypothetical protein